MAYKYCVATNWGKDFFTARERMNFELSGHPGDVWVVGDNLYGAKWIKKVNGVSKTKDYHQNLKLLFEFHSLLNYFLLY